MCFKTDRGCSLPKCANQKHSKHSLKHALPTTNKKHDAELRQRQLHEFGLDTPNGMTRLVITPRDVLQVARMLEHALHDQYVPHIVASILGLSNFGPVIEFTKPHDPTDNARLADMRYVDFPKSLGKVIDAQIIYYIKADLCNCCPPSHYFDADNMCILRVGYGANGWQRDSIISQSLHPAFHVPTRNGLTAVSVSLVSHSGWMDPKVTVKGIIVQCARALRSTKGGWVPCSGTTVRVLYSSTIYNPRTGRLEEPTSG